MSTSRDVSPDRPDPVPWAYAAARAGGADARLADWVARYPADAEELIDLDLLLMEAPPEAAAPPAADPDPLGRRMLETALDEALGPAVLPSLFGRAQALGLSRAQLADRLGLRGALDVLHSLEKRWVSPPLPGPLIDRLSAVLACGRDQVRQYFHRPAFSPGFYNAPRSKAPGGLHAAHGQTFRAAIEQSPSLAPDDRREWLRILDDSIEG